MAFQHAANSLGYYAGLTQLPSDEIFLFTKEEQTRTLTISFTLCALPALWYEESFTCTSYISAHSTILLAEV